jgi:hypothetical protein
MATITNRTDFTNYCLRRLGAPVLNINVDDDQVNDRVDDALQYWQDYHFDGLQKVYYIKGISNSTLVTTAPINSFISNIVTLVGVTSGATATIQSLAADNITLTIACGQVPFIVGEAINYIDSHNVTHSSGLNVASFIFGEIDKRYLDLSQSTDAQGNAMEIVGISRIFPLSDSQANVNMFDLRYQLRLNELYDFTSASYINYTLTQQHLRSLEIMFTGEVPIRFQRHMQRLYIDWGWGTEAPSGTVVIAECYAAINPDVYVKVWNDRWLKEYATALIKRSWGENMKKFGGLQLPGGVTLNGKETYDEACVEIERLEKEMEMNYGAPLEWFLN